MAREDVDDRIDIAVLAERVKNLETEVQGVKKTAMETKDTLSKASGGFTVLVLLGGGIAFAAGVAKDVFKWFQH